MSTRGTIKKYTLIIEKIQKGQRPSKSVIKQYLIEQGFKISDRTLERDIEAIRYEFGVEIKYFRTNNYYTIENENSHQFESFLKFLEVVNTAQLLTDSLIESKCALKYISFESAGSLKGINFLKPILEAIQANKKIEFLHYNFITEKKTKYVLMPYLLKEYQNRWYVFGQLQNNEFRTFGIDRIEDLIIKSETFLLKKNFDATTLFDNVIGLNYSVGSVEEVVLHFTPLQGKYIKALPLHFSQEIIRDDDELFVIKLHIVPNLEFKQRLLMFANQVKVIQPKWLIDEIKKMLNSSLNNYK